MEDLASSANQGSTARVGHRRRNAQHILIHLQRARLSKTVSAMPGFGGPMAAPAHSVLAIITAKAATIEHHARRTAMLQQAAIQWRIACANGVTLEILGISAKNVPQTAIVPVEAMCRNAPTTRSRFQAAGCSRTVPAGVGRTETQEVRISHATCLSVSLRSFCGLDWMHVPASYWNCLHSSSSVLHNCTV